jgi:hypothetical protein
MKKFLPILFLLLSACSRSQPTIKLGNCTIETEIANTRAEISQGLLYRDSLPENHGMFFELLSPVGPRTNEYFHMRNMAFPIEMLFFSSNLTLKDIQKAEPCYSESCTEYRPRENSWYVLEVPVGTAERCNALLGTQISKPE